MIAYPQPVIADWTAARRTCPRKPEQRQPGFDERFDWTTVFYDVIHHEGRFILSGPPLAGFEGITADGLELDRLDGSRATRLTAAGEYSPTVTFRLGDERTVAPVTPSSSRFDGRNVLFTLSLNNPLLWVRDWVEWHVQRHNIDAVLIYDNGSTAYSLRDLHAAIGDVEGVKEAVVVSWPFLYGPQGGIWAGDKSIPWDSDYAQIGAMDNARWRYLQGARSVLSIDVDELVLSDRPVCDIAAQEGYVRFDGYWVESVPLELPLVEPRRHHHFGYAHVQRGRCGWKWAADPRMPDHQQWTAHAIYKRPDPPTFGVEVAHFLPINDDWKRKRTTIGTLDPEKHYLIPGLS